MPQSTVLGLFCFGRHDASAALVRGGDIVAAAEEERFSRRKFDASFPAAALAACLRLGELRLDEVDAVAFGWNPKLHRVAKLRHVVRYLPASLALLAGSLGRHRKLDRARAEVEALTGYRGPFHAVNHHLAHAASTFFPSPFDEAAVLTVDGVGEWETVWMGRGRGTHLERCASQGWPHSLGAVYTAFTQFLGFEIFSDEYKVMGLAPYGEPRFLETLRRVVTPTRSGLRVDPSFFRYHLGAERLTSPRFEASFGAPRRPEEPIEDRHRDLAASLQRHTEDLLLHLARLALRRAGSKRLCLAGGVALNSVAIGRIADEGVAEEVFVPPCPGDAGVSLGAALFASHALRGAPRGAPLCDARLGPRWEDARVERALVGSGLPYDRIRDVTAEAARALAAGEVVGWFQGRMEFGQRALGARSILADPRRPDMKERVNARVKFRESFRPFAPSVPEERVAEFFHARAPIPFMTRVARVREEARERIPAVTHVDGTGRVQTVSRAVDPLYWELLERVGEHTGVPVLLNTSFNVKGEPIVNTPEEAVACFERAGLDRLYIGGFAVRPPGSSASPPRAGAG